MTRDKLSRLHCWSELERGQKICSLLSLLLIISILLIAIILIFALPKPSQPSPSTTPSLSSSTTTLTTFTSTLTTSTSTTSPAQWEELRKPEYLFLSDQKILSLPGFEPLQCSIDLPVSGIMFGNVGLVETEGGERLVVGGGVTGGVNTLDQWWVRTEEGWTDFTPPQRSRSFSASSVYGGGGLLVTGGKADDEDIPELFSAGGWSSLPPTPNHLYNHAQVNLQDRIYLIGGRGRNDRLDVLLVLNTSSWEWESLSPLREAREFHSCSSLLGQIYCVGGDSITGEVLSSTEIYSPDLNTWTRGPDLPRGLRYHQAVSQGDTLYVVGGQDNNQVFSLSPGEDQWTTLQNVSVTESLRVVFPAVKVTKDLLFC